MIAGAAALAVLFRIRGSLAGRVFAVGMLLLSAEAGLHFISLRQELLADRLYWQKLRLVPVAMIPAAWVTFSLVYSRGNYREYLRRWRAALVTLAVLPPLTVALGLDTLLTATLSEEGGLHWSLELGWAAQVIYLVVVAAAVLVLMNLEQTFRASVGTQRWRLKLVVLGLGALFSVRIYTASQALLYQALIEHMPILSSAALIVACLLIGFSILRTGGFSIDIYPSQAALQRSVVVLVVGVYLVVVGLLAKLAGVLENAEQFQLNALIIFLALVGLAVLLMSDRLRQAIRAALNRHFRRPHYEYRKLWSSFTNATADHSTEEAAAAALAKWVSGTLDALSVSVWLFDEHHQRLRLAGSTLDASQLPTGGDGPPAGRWTEIEQAVFGLDKILNLGGGQEVESPAPGLLQPRQFPNGGDRWAVPLRAAGRSLGVLIVGDRVSGVPVTAEDVDLLQTVAEQAAGLLTGIRLSRKLLAAREMEAFQSMSTFFVHDLKNTASGLSLMLQNLPRHFDKPEFRDDALKSIRRSVERIDHLIQSLSALRRKLVMTPAPGDLAELRETAETVARERGIVLHLDLQAAGPVLMDRDQLARVVTNLIVNAHEASVGDAPVTVTSGRNDGTATLTVTDQGCGMSREFIANQLFRPFQTTKKSGTGIGLYHSKMIVDAHGGRMEVQSAPGDGTRISIVLPIVKAAP